MRKLFWSLLLGSATIAIGCSKPASTTGTTDAPKTEAAPAATQTSASNPKVVQPETQATPAPSATAQQLAPPEEVVALFFDSMRRGDESTTVALLTSKAQEELTKAGLDVQPPGSPESSYKVGRVSYLDETKDSAYVESLLNEPAVNGQESKPWEIVWALRKETQGWRIAGFAVEMSENESPVVVDFENGADTKAKVEGVTTGQGNPIANANGQAAPAQTGIAPSGISQSGIAPAGGNAGVQPSAGPANLPAFPSGSQPVQTANPNLPTGTIPR